MYIHRLHTYILTYILHSYVHTYIHTYIHTYKGNYNNIIMLNKYTVHLCLIAGYGRNQWETKIRNHAHLYCAPAAVVTALPWADPLPGDEERPR